MSSDSDLESICSLEQVVLRFGRDLVEIVTQDEYTHDVIVRRDGGFLVFDTT